MGNSFRDIVRVETGDVVGAVDRNLLGLGLHGVDAAAVGLADLMGKKFRVETGLAVAAARNGLLFLLGVENCDDLAAAGAAGNGLLFPLAAENCYDLAADLLWIHLVEIDRIDGHDPDPFDDDLLLVDCLVVVEM